VSSKTHRVIWSISIDFISYKKYHWDTCIPM